MRLIDADKLIKDRVANDPVRIAAMCEPTAFDKTKVLRYLKARKEGAAALDDDFNAGMATAYR